MTHLFHPILFCHLRMWQQEEWDFYEFWNCSIDNNIGHPIGNGFVQQSTLRITSCVSNQQAATRSPTNLTRIYLQLILAQIDESLKETNFSPK